MRTSKRFASILGIALVAFGTSAFAAISISWTFTGCSDGVAGATCSKTTSGVMATAQAWSSTVNAGGGTNNAMQTAYLRQYGSSGLGITNQDTQTGSTCTSGQDCNETFSGPLEHAVDNNGRYDAILFSFNEAITLTQVKIGWPTTTPPNDSDITVLAYEDAGAPSLAGQTFQNMIDDGWELAGNYGDVANRTDNTANVNTTDSYASKYWLIGAYNSAFGGSALDTTYDYVKILMLAGTQTTQVPEPSTLLLFGIAAMAGLWRRRHHAHG